ncbi:hypothetical protein SKAU_G00269870 [Synaphobranchus kaupii]|uniref:Uncharacterized protein n=1 Tax=Synaphobranchus kaupii TaxID=118154 RepID=A0A9Q1F050_SYNKA|nr:hypothetical protein SKAU_G00269870 [Synaphobranchus kaupii]
METKEPDAQFSFPRSTGHFCPGTVIHRGRKTVINRQSDTEALKVFCYYVLLIRCEVLCCGLPSEDCVGLT